MPKKFYKLHVLYKNVESTLRHEIRGGELYLEPPRAITSRKVSGRKLKGDPNEVKVILGNTAIGFKDLGNMTLQRVWGLVNTEDGYVIVLKVLVGGKEEELRLPASVTLEKHPRWMGQTVRYPHPPSSVREPIRQ